MKQLLSIIIFLGCSLGATAQYWVGDRGNQIARFKEVEHLDSSFLECVYQYIVHDPVLDETRDDFKILAVGHNFSKYSDYGAYQIDSIRFTDYPEGITNADYHRLSLKILPSWEAYIKDYDNKIIKTYDKVFIDKYTYDEPINPINWVLQPGSEEICGHSCCKATTSFRGREWTAWYAPDVPVDNGPWKFGGLPGLILKLESEDGEQKFAATSIRKNKSDINIKKSNYLKTTREKFNKELEEYMTRPRQFHIANPTMAPKDKDGNIATPEFRRLFFNPIELE